MVAGLATNVTKKKTRVCFNTRTPNLQWSQKTYPFRFGSLEAIRSQPRAICLFSFGKCVFPKISVCFQPPKKARWFTNNEPNYVSTNISFCFQPPKKSSLFHQQWAKLRFNKNIFLFPTTKKKLAVSPTMSHTTFQQKPPKKSPLLHQTQIPFVSNHKNKSRWCTNKKNKNAKNKISVFSNHKVHQQKTKKH